MSLTMTVNRGEKLKLLDALTTTADTKGTSYAIPSPLIGKQVTWQTYYAVAPGAVDIQLQVALEDTDALYSVLDESTDTNGETRNIYMGQARFIRARQVSRTGGTAYTTVQIVIG